MYVENPVAWGAKRTCQDCKTKYYDLQRNPAVCPKCHAEYVEPPKAKRPARDAAASRARGRATSFGFNSPQPRRSGDHSPFAEAIPSAEDAPAKVSDDGDADDQKDADDDSGDKAEAEEVTEDDKDHNA